jgi:16S rRNA (cytosine1402-N4)-methyltransferase
MHISVLKEEIQTIVQKYKESINIAVDFTFGGGGHSKIILDNSMGKVIAIDRDVTTEKFALSMKTIYKERFEYHVDISYNMNIYTKSADLILGDLGLSQMQLADSRGFAYKHNSPLDMQMGVDSLGSVCSFLRSLSEYKIGEILREYGEEPQWRKIAASIVANKNRINDTFALRNIINGVVKKDVNKALSRCFQAFRIFTNQELIILDKTLQTAYELLKIDGIMLIITFNSLEDRIVKTFFKKYLTNLQLINPTFKEINENPQSRSAKLRVGFKV